ncbi:MAG: hypothetical protein VSS75_033105 [Candidatus Parabeggiatoa sp.]|nr:hypothetical protein [Candidatus Parabeggiatoa sp.]
MKKTKNASSQQGHLIKPAVVVDLRKLLNESKLSENEKGLIKRRLIESRQPFGDVLQRLVNQAKQETGSLDMPESLKQLEEKEGKEIRSFDSIAKVLSQEFPQLLQFILDEYQVEAEKTKALIGKEFIAVKRIADVIFEAKDKKGGEVIIHLEFESQYKSDEQMDKRKLEYRHLMEMDDDYQGKVVLCNVFYLRGSPEDKDMIEDRTVKLPTSDPRYSGELKYKAYHLSLMTIETMLKRKLPFLLPFFVQSELRSLDKASTSKTMGLTVSLKKQIDEHEAELSQMIDGLTAEQMESLRTSVEYLWKKSYSDKVFNKSTLLKLMREQLNFRQRDIELGKTERAAQEMSVLQRLLQDGKINQEQLEYFLNYMKEEDEKRQQTDSANLNQH